MTLLNEPPVTSTTTEAPVYTPRRPSIGKAIVNWATSTDHKTIGYMYIFTSMIWFFIAVDIVRSMSSTFVLKIREKVVFMATLSYKH